jgi:hypothetical protein
MDIECIGVNISKKRIRSLKDIVNIALKTKEVCVCVCVCYIYNCKPTRELSMFNHEE